MRRCAVLGSPVAHSLSPVLHRAAYAYLGLDWVYERHQVEADGLADFVGTLDSSWRGLSCTMPLKEAVVPLGVCDDLVAALGVGNTVVFEGAPCDPTTTRIHNTDVPGLESALRAAGASGATSALLLGNGATARSAVLALALLGVTTVGVLARDPVKTELLAGLGTRYGVAVRHLGLTDALPPSDVAVSSVPAGVAAGQAKALTEAARIVFDAVYDPWPTPLASAAGARGRIVVSGLDLLAHQAVGQVQLFTGLSVPASVLLTAGQEALRARSRP